MDLASGLLHGFSVALTPTNLLFGFLGLLGDNVRIVSERTRRTPLVIERERINFTDHGAQ